MWQLICHMYSNASQAIYVRSQSFALSSLVVKISTEVFTCNEFTPQRVFHFAVSQHARDQQILCMRGSCG